MPVQFPVMHIAQSVMNRLLNALDDTEPVETMPMQAPIPPADTRALGQQIEETTAEPVEAVQMPEDPVEAEVAAESLTGGSPFDGALIGSM